MKEKLQGRIRELAELVRYHADLYYNKAKPELTDAEFDSLVSELRGLVEQLRQENPGDEAISDGEQALAEVGSIPTYGRKVSHASVMGSLDKETSFDGVRQWENKYGRGGVILVTPKMDGCAVRLNYVDGILKEAATRGDGAVGQDILDNVKEMTCIPKRLASKVTVEVRGEAYMTRSTFDRLRDSGERAFANPRNAASGSLMAKDPKITGRRSLSFMGYDVLNCGETFHSEKEKRTWVAVNLIGIEFVPANIIKIDGFEGVAVGWESNRPNLDYEIDGLVVAFDSIDVQEEAGWNGKCPRGKVAFKFKPEQKTAKVIGIDWQVGRTGKLCPMARIEPTLLAGSTISNITLHNAARLQELDLLEGDEVLIEKGGDIIPQVVRVVSRMARKKNLPEQRPAACPSCGSPTLMDDKGVNLWCEGDTCPAKLEGRVLHYIKTLDVLGVGEGIISGLCRAGYVKDIPDLYYLTMEQVKDVTGGDRAAEKVMTAIMDKNQIPLAVFLDSLGIHGLGTTTSKLVAKKFMTLSQVMFLKNPNVLTSIEGIGELSARKILEGLEAMRPMIDRLIKCIDIDDVASVAVGNLTGKSFCLTGAMSKPRKEIEKEIEAAGGEVRSSVGKGLTYLVQADATSTSSKSEKAKALGTKILGEAELMEMMK